MASPTGEGTTPAPTTPLRMTPDERRQYASGFTTFTGLGMGFWEAFRYFKIHAFPSSSKELALYVPRSAWRQSYGKGLIIAGLTLFGWCSSDDGMKFLAHNRQLSRKVIRMKAEFEQLQEEAAK